ncbi:MAG: choice-of-anchor tandem repeat NxxGxxAF-containing protein [Planctomycetota bacterium]
MNRSFVAASIASLCSAPLAIAGASIPTYAGFQVQASTGNITFNLPAGASISNATPDINNSGQVTFEVTVPSATQIWRGGNAMGGSVAEISQAAGFVSVSDPTINNAGRVVWSQDDVPGVYSVDAAGSPAALYTNDPFGTSTFGSPQILDDDTVGFRGRAGFGPRFHASVNPFLDVPPTIFAQEMPGLSFLFTPRFNNNTEVATKLTRDAGFNEEEVVTIDASGARTTIAQNNDIDPMSPYSSFGNSLGFNDHGQVALAATLAASGDRTIVLTDGTTETTIATEGVGDVSDIEFFSPVVNNNGLVAFRAFDASGNRSIFVGDGTDLVKVATEGTAITGGNGESLFIGRLIDTGPSFGGGISINDLGEIVFNAQLNNGQTLLGAGIIVAQIPAPGSLALLGLAPLATRRKR